MPSKKEETKEIQLNAVQVDKLNLYAAQATAAQQRLNEYLSAVCDAVGVEGQWESLGLKDKTLKLRKKG